MSTFIKPLTRNNVHKLLYTKNTELKKPEQLSDAEWREVNRKIYKEKCENFVANVKKCHDDNFNVLIRHDFSEKPKPDDSSKLPEPDKRRSNDSSNISFENSKKSLQEEKQVLNEHGLDPNYGKRPIENEYRPLPGRPMRHFTEKPEISTKVCGFEPWLKRYLVLNRFIEAVRKIIIRNRLMKRLARLKVVTADRELLRRDSSVPLRMEYINYSDLTYKLQLL